MVSEDMDPDPYYPADLDLYEDMEAWISDEPDEPALPILFYKPSYPHTACVQLGMSLRGMMPKAVVFTTAQRDAPWDRFWVHLQVPQDIRDRFFLTHHDCGPEVRCHMVTDLITPHCGGQGCIPCFLAHTTRAQRDTRFQMRRIINTWHAVMTKFCAVFCSTWRVMHAQTSQEGHGEFIGRAASVLMQLPRGTLEILSAKGGIRITKGEILHMASRGLLHSTLGNLTPLHLTCREIFLMEYVAIQFTTGLPDKVLDLWLVAECPQYPWARFQDLTTEDLTAQVARALLGLVQLILEDHLTPRMGPMTYIPKAQAIALWEYMETGIRTIVPCMICALMGETHYPCNCENMPFLNPVDGIAQG